MPCGKNLKRMFPQDVTLIPGAKEFIEKARRLGVTVVFISNRMEPFRKSTEIARWQEVGLESGLGDIASPLCT